MSRTGYSGVYENITHRDDLIQIAYDLACIGDLLVVNHTSQIPHDHREMYLHVYKLGSMVESSENHYRVVLRHPAGRSMVSALPHLNEVEVVYKTTFNAVKIALDMSEEECFQDSLVNAEAIEYNVLQQINKLVQYGLDNVEDIL